nr:hypothetical protein Iba_chr06fCG1870 [Ipomoea batatas]
MVIRCILSFSASSSNALIQPPLCSNLRRDLRCRSIPPTIPGTAATVSSIIARHPYRLCTKISVGILRSFTVLKANLSMNVFGTWCLVRSIDTSARYVSHGMKQFHGHALPSSLVICGRMMPQ